MGGLVNDPNIPKSYLLIRYVKQHVNYMHKLIRLRCFLLCEDAAFCQLTLPFLTTFALKSCLFGVV